MNKQEKQKPIHQLSVKQFEVLFHNEQACCDYLQDNRWPGGVCCPRCGNIAVYALESRVNHWVCKECGVDGYRFSVLVGTIFENTNKPLRDWFKVMHLMLTSKKGVSALQIYRYMGFGSYKTAWGMCHKIRTALGNVEFQQLVGYVEVDETYVGGKAKNKHKKDRNDKDGHGGGSGRGTAGKIPVIGAVSRKGNVIARVINNTDTHTLESFIRQTVSHKVSLISTDEHAGYRHLSQDYPHGVVCHSVGQYAVGAIHTNTIEGFWSLFKRGVIGTYHRVSRKYIQLYVNEFEFRYNNRKNPDIFQAAIQAC